MKTRHRPFLVPALLGLALAVFGFLLSYTPVASAATAPTGPNATARVVATANAFLSSLDEATRAKAVFAANDDAQRKRWSNFPSGIFERKGLRLGDLSKPQRAAVDALLTAALSPMGLQKTLAIMEGDEALRTAERPGRLLFGRDEYYVSFVGQPSATDRWIIQFGGHHLALNITVIGSQNLLAPSHTAAQPATYTVDGKIIRPLGKETDLSFQLINTLNEAQKKDAILGARFRDLVLGPGQDGRTIVPEGVKVSSFDESQKTLLLELIKCWVGIINEEAANRKLAEIKTRLDETYFAWSGPTTSGAAAYFRIHGPTVFIEFAPQQMGSDPTNHIHTILRDPSSEYGVPIASK